MLVLSRKEADSIVINGSIKIKVLRIKRHSICLGIEAPLEVSVVRSELDAHASAVLDLPQTAGAAAEARSPGSAPRISKMAKPYDAFRPKSRLVSQPALRKNTPYTSP